MNNRNDVKKIVIYTAVVGCYDVILQPKVINEEYDYILFSNDINDNNVGVWKIRRIPYSNNDKTRIARWVKTHPEELLVEYEYSVWMDANLQIISSRFYDIISNHIETGALVSSMWHNKRNCIYDETIAVAYCELENEHIIIDWLRFLLKENYPQQNGLYETGVTFRNNNSKEVKKLDNLWWMCIEQFSRRDQLSFNYALWKYGINCPYFISSSENARNSNCIKYHYHKNDKTRKTYYSKQNFVFINYYKAVSTKLDVVKLKKIYLRIAKLPYPYFLLYLLGQIYRLRIHMTFSH